MNKITKTGIKGIQMIKSFESFISKPYKCPAGIPTIGYGNTFYENGIKVTMLDHSISEERATELLMNILTRFEQCVDSYCIDTINQNQFDALVSFSYNVGTEALRSSTLLKKLNKNINDPTIKDEFLKWNKANGRALPGLTHRRQAEAELYFTAV